MPMAGLFSEMRTERSNTTKNVMNAKMVVNRVAKYNSSLVRTSFRRDRETIPVITRRVNPAICPPQKPRSDDVSQGRKESRIKALAGRSHAYAELRRPATPVGISGFIKIRFFHQHFCRNRHKTQQKQGKNTSEVLMEANYERKNINRIVYRQSRSGRY